MTKTENHSGGACGTGPFFRWMQPRRPAVPYAATPGTGRFLSHTNIRCPRIGDLCNPRSPLFGHHLALPILLAVAGLLTSGCGTTGSANRPGSGADGRLSGGLAANEIVARLPPFPAALDTLYAEADVQVSTPEDNGRFRARIAYRRADSMLIRVRFPLGIEGARVLVTPDSAFVYDRIDKQLIAGTPESVSRVLPVAVAGTNLVDMATGFYAPHPDTEWVITADSLQLVLERSDERVRMIVDPDIWRITNLQFRDAEGMILEERWYMNFALFNQTLLPRRMALSRPSEDTRLTMVLRELDASPGDLSFDLGVDSDAKRLRLD